MPSKRVIIRNLKKQYYTKNRDNILKNEIVEMKTQRPFAYTR